MAFFQCLRSTRYDAGIDPNFLYVSPSYSFHVLNSDRYTIQSAIVVSHCHTGAVTYTKPKITRSILPPFEVLPLDFGCSQNLAFPLYNKDNHP